MKKRGLSISTIALTTVLVLGGCGAGTSSETTANNMIKVATDYDNDTATYLDRNGNVITFDENKDGFTINSDFVHNSAVVYAKGDYGIINCKGKMVVDFGKYDDIDDISDSGFYSAEKDNLCGVLDSKGKEIIPFLYEKIDLVRFEEDNKNVVFLSCENADESVDLYNSEGKQLLDDINTVDSFFSSSFTIYGIKEKAIMTYSYMDENNDQRSVYFNGATGEELAKETDTVSVYASYNCLLQWDENTDISIVKAFDENMNQTANMELPGHFNISRSEGSYFLLHDFDAQVTRLYDINGKELYHTVNDFTILYDSNKQAHFIEDIKQDGTYYQVFMNSKLEEEFRLEGRSDGRDIYQYAPYFFMEKNSVFTAYDFTGKAVYENIANVKNAHSAYDGNLILFLEEKTIFMYGSDAKEYVLDFAIDSLDSQLADDNVLLKADGCYISYDLTRNKEIHKFDKGVNLTYVPEINALKEKDKYYSINGKLLYEEKDN